MGSDSVTDDNDVVKKVLSGDREAYRVLVDKYGSRVVAFCRSRMRSEEDPAMPPRTCFSALFFPGLVQAARASPPGFSRSREPCEDTLSHFPVRPAQNRGAGIELATAAPADPAEDVERKFRKRGSGARFPPCRPICAGLWSFTISRVVRCGNRARLGPWRRGCKDEAFRARKVLRHLLEEKQPKPGSRGNQK